MTFIADLPKSPGTYRHRWIDPAGCMKEQTLFVGYTNARAPRLQGTEPNAYMPRKLKCCKPEENLHADRLTPEEWGGWWEHVTPNAIVSGLAAQRKLKMEETTAAAMLVDSYEDFCGVERGRFDGCTLSEMKDSAAFAGFGDYVAGWCAAIDAAVKEAERSTFALDNGGNQYRRPAGADVVAAVLRKLRPNAK